MRKRGNVGSKVKAQAAIEAAKGLHPVGQIAKQFGVPPIQIGKWRKRLLDCAYQVFEEGVVVVDAASHERELQELYEQIGRLKVENGFLKKNLVSTVEDRRMLIDPACGSMSIAQQCELLAVNRSSFYYEPSRDCSQPGRAVSNHG